MNTSIMPALGSNQHVTKFDAKPKSKFKAKVKKTVRIVKLVYLVVTLLGTIWGIRITQQTYQLKCVVNGATVGYFSRRAECQNAYQNWVDSQQSAIEAHTQEMLINNPDL